MNPVCPLVDRVHIPSIICIRINLQTSTILTVVKQQVLSASQVTLRHREKCPLVFTGWKIKYSAKKYPKSILKRVWIPIACLALRYFVDYSEYSFWCLIGGHFCSTLSNLGLKWIDPAAYCKIIFIIFRMFFTTIYSEKYFEYWSWYSGLRTW